MKMQTLKSFAAVAVLVCLCGCPMGSESEGRAGLVDSEEDSGLSAPTNLICESSQLDVFLSWDNGATYEELQVKRDGVLVATLAGGVTSLTDSPGAVGVYTYSVCGIAADGEFSAVVECAAETSNLSSITNFTCTFRSVDNEVAMTWELPDGVSFDELRLRRDGQLLAILGAGAVSHVDANPPEGSVDYELRGLLGAETTPPETCSVAIVLAEISGLSGSIDSSNGDIVLQWQNGESYETITVFCGDEAIATLDGGATSFRFEHDSLGVYTFALTGSRGALESECVFWQGDVGRLVWEDGEGGTVAGYHVYVWAEGEAVPAGEEPSMTLGATTTISLADLLDEGLLPVCAEPSIFNIAIAAYDAEDKISEMSSPIQFAWQVVDSTNFH